MELTSEQHPITRERIFTLRISEADFLTMRLSPMDHRVIEDCDKPDASIADRLLGLELICRRIEESVPKVTHP